MENNMKKINNIKKVKKLLSFLLVLTSCSMRSEPVTDFSQKNQQIHEIKATDSKLISELVSLVLEIENYLKIKVENKKKLIETLVSNVDFMKTFKFYMQYNEDLRKTFDRSEMIRYLSLHSAISGIALYSGESIYSILNLASEAKARTEDSTEDSVDFKKLYKLVAHGLIVLGAAAYYVSSYMFSSGVKSSESSQLINLKGYICDHIYKEMVKTFTEKSAVKKTENNASHEIINN